jgi:acetyl/propionyl-CoA carboxylase alpha subunit
MPDTGIIELYETPKGSGVRVDDCTKQGSEVSIYYDPMISKLIVHADNRVDAIKKMINAINNYKIYGLKTTLSFCKYALNHSNFRSGNFDTGFVNLYMEDFKSMVDENNSNKVGLAAIFQLYKMDKISTSFLPSTASNWVRNR